MILLPIEIIKHIYSFLDYKNCHKKKFSYVINDIKDIGISLKTYNKPNYLPNDMYTLPNSLENKFLKVNHLYYYMRKLKNKNKQNIKVCG